MPAADNKVSPIRGAEYGAFIQQDCILHGIFRMEKSSKFIGFGGEGERAVLKCNGYYLRAVIHSLTDFNPPTYPPTHPPARSAGKSHEFRPFGQYPREKREGEGERERGS